MPNSFLCPKIHLEFFCLWKDTNEFSVLKMMAENVNVVLSVMDTKCVNTMKSREGFIFLEYNTLTNHESIRRNVYLFFPWERE